MKFRACLPACFSACLPAFWRVFAFLLSGRFCLLAAFLSQARALPPESLVARAVSRTRCCASAVFLFVSCPPFVAVYLDFRVPMGTKDDQLRLKQGERARSECQKWLWRVSGFCGFCFHVLDARLSRRSARHAVGELCLSSSVGRAQSP